MWPSLFSQECNPQAATHAATHGTPIYVLSHCYRGICLPRSIRRVRRGRFPEDGHTKPEGYKKVFRWKQMSKLSNEEREILEAFERGTLKQSNEAAETQKRHQEYANAM